MSFIKAIKSTISSYISKNEQRHRELKECTDKATNIWEKIKNEFPDEIRQLLKNTNQDSGSNLILINDDDTPMEYVVFVLENLFGMESEVAIKTMLEVHEKGSSVIATSISSESATKLVLYLQGHANSRGYPLKWKVENA